MDDLLQGHWHADVVSKPVQHFGMTCQASDVMLDVHAALRKCRAHAGSSAASDVE